MRKRKKRICMIGTDWNNNEYRRVNNAPGAISTYRLIYPKRYLEQAYDVDYWGSDFGDGSEGKDTGSWYKAFFEKYDIIISKITDNPQAAGCICFMAKHLGIPLVVDIDDNIWELKPDQPGYRTYYKGSTALATASTYVSSADAVFCSTRPLADYVEKRVKAVHGRDIPVFVLPNCVDPEDYRFERAETDPEKVVIGWQGSTTHHEDLKVAMPAIGRLMREFPNLHLELLGGVPQDSVKDLFDSVEEDCLGRITCRGGVPAFDTFPHLLSQQAWDIAIAPLTDEPFNHSKSHIKWMEYAMFGIPCVASLVYPYYVPVGETLTIADGRTGLLASPGEWEAQLRRLIEDPALRKEVGEGARRYVTEEWDIRKKGVLWEEAVGSLLEAEGE